MFDDFGQRLEILASRGGSPPSQTYRTSRLRLGKAQQFYPLVVSFGIGSYFRHECDTVTVCHHLYHGRERGGSEPGHGCIPASGSTKREGLVAQAVSFLQQDQPMLIDIRNANAAAKREFVGSRHRKQERIVKQPEGLNIGVLRRQCQQDAIKLTARKLLKQYLCLRLAQLKPQARILCLQAWQHAWQHIRRERRNDAELERPAEHITVAREVDKIAGGGENLFGAFGYFQPSIGERDLVRAAFNQLDPNLALELAHLHG